MATVAFRPFPETTQSEFALCDSGDHRRFSLGVIARRYAHSIPRPATVTFGHDKTTRVTPTGR